MLFSFVLIMSKERYSSITGKLSLRVKLIILILQTFLAMSLCHSCGVTSHALWSWYTASCMQKRVTVSQCVHAYSTQYIQFLSYLIDQTVIFTTNCVCGRGHKISLQHIIFNCRVLKTIIPPIQQMS